MHSQNFKRLGRADAEIWWMVQADMHLVCHGAIFLLKFSFSIKSQSILAMRYTPEILKGYIEQMLRYGRWYGLICT